MQQINFKKEKIIMIIEKNFSVTKSCVTNSNNANNDLYSLFVYKTH